MGAVTTMATGTLPPDPERSMCTTRPPQVRLTPELYILTQLHSLNPLAPTVAARHRQSPWPLISVREALERIFAQAGKTKVETHVVEPELVGAVLAEDIFSPRNVPSAPSTNIDGYAVRGMFECFGTEGTESGR